MHPHTQFAGDRHPSGPGPCRPVEPILGPLPRCAEQVHCGRRGTSESGTPRAILPAPCAARTLSLLLFVPCTGECPAAAEMVLCNACYRHSHRVPPNTSWTSAEVPVVTTRSVGARGSWKSKRRPTVLHHQEQSPPRLSSGAGPRQHGMGSGLHVAGECARTGRFPVISHPHHPHTHRNRALSFAELTPPRYLSILRGSMSLAKSVTSAPTTASSRCTVRPLWGPEAGM